MENTWINIIPLLCLIALNGFFAMSEFAVLSCRKARLQNLVDKGEKRAGSVIGLLADITRTISTIQVGKTTISILSGVIGRGVLADPITTVLMSYGMAEDTAGLLGLVVAVVLITYVTLIFGEIVPKCIGTANAETVACRVVGFLRSFSVVMVPFVKMLSFSAKTVMNLIGAKSAKSGVTAEEINAMVEEGSEVGNIDRSERDMVRNVFRLDDRQVGSIMTPRSDILWIDVDDDQDENFRKVVSSYRSRFVVSKGGLDNVLGTCSTRKLLRQMVETGRMDFTSGLDDVTYVPESLSGMELLDHFKSSVPSTALVVDEYGSVVGLVTPRDTLEAIAGEFKAGKGEKSPAVQCEDGSWILEGIIPVPEFKDILGIRLVPEEKHGRYNTLSGMIMLLLERIPVLGDSVEWDGWRFEVTEMDGRRIDKVRAVPAQCSESSSPDESLSPGN